MKTSFTNTQNLRRSTNWRIIFGLLMILSLISGYSSIGQIKVHPPNYSFETPVTTGYTYNPTGGSWTFSGGAGVLLSPSGFSNPASPDGNQAAFLQNNSSVISQQVTLTATIYKISFYAAQRPGNSQSIQVSYGSTIIDTITAAGTAYALYTTKPFNVTTSGSDLLSFKGLASGDITSFIDDINIFSVSTIKMDNIEATTIDMGSGIKSVNLTGISSNPANSNITLSATSDNASVIPNTFTINPNSLTPGQHTATLSFTAGTQAGIANIFVKAANGIDTIERQFTVIVRNPLINNAPNFGVPTNATLNLGHGYEYIMIPNISDGDGNTQNITFTFVNNSPSVIEVAGITYNKGDKVAILKVRAASSGSASITITAKDDGGTANGGFDTYSKDITLNTKIFSNPGLYTAYYDVAFWLPSLPDDAVPHPGSVKIVSSANEPFSYLSQGQLWRKMWGYITPTVTGDYSFKTVGDWSSQWFNLSTDANPANKKTVATETNNSPTPSDPITLVAGNTYYWDATYTSYDAHAWSIYVAPPDLGYSYLDGSLSSPIFDTVAPTAVKNLRKITTGVNDLYVQWDASTDNAFMGYFIYVNGVKQSDTIRDTKYLVKNLQPSTTYSVAVRAFDLYENGSLPSNILTLKTYPVDNTPPTVPTGVTLVKPYDIGLQISWTASTDAETEIRGYNVYYEGSSTPINTEIIKDPSYLITNLATKTTYKLQVEAVDAGYNKSAKSAVATFATTDFNPTSVIPGFKKGRLQFTMKPIATSNGIGVNGDYGPGSVLMRNRISNPGFEAVDGKLGHTPSGGAAYSILIKSASPADVYAGNRSIKLSGSANENLNNPITLRIRSDKKYTMRFAMKKSTTSNPTVKLNVLGRFGQNVWEQTMTPTDSWKLYEYQVTPNWAGDDEVSFSVQFTLATNGSIYLDEVQFFEEGDDYLVNGNLTEYSKYGMGLLNEFKPSGLRWGGIGANMDNFNDHVGFHQNTFTYAEWIQMASLVGAKAAMVCGVNEATEWFKDSTNFTKFADYIAGDASTIYGQKRIDAGIADVMTTSPGVLLELGNEVWGGDAHGAKTWAGNPTAYGKWARSRSAALKLSTGYQAHKSKIWTAYSGGTTDLTSFGGWTRKAYLGDQGEVDVISIMGYMGGNLGFAPEIPRGKSLLDYHKNTVSLLPNYWAGMAAMQKDMIKSIGVIKPYYMYEGNMTTGDYHGHLGQAINFTDYYVGNIERQVMMPEIFQLSEGGEWGILETKTLKKLPLFHTGALVNNYCKGIVLSTKFISGDSVVDAYNQKVGIEPVSAHTYVNGSDYTILLISRDFENSFRVQLELPDSIKTAKGYKMYTITGKSLEDTDVMKDSVINTTTSLDSMLVTVAPYSMMVIRFKANSYVLNAPAEGTLVNNARVTSIDVVSSTGAFHLPSAGQTLILTPTVNPSNAFDNSTSMSILSGNTATGTTVTKNADGTYLVTAGSTPGTITVRIKAGDGSGVFKDTPISVITAVQTKVASYSVLVSPNPTNGVVNIDLPSEANQSTMKLYTLTGVLVSEKSVSPGLQSIDLSKQAQGVYILQIVDSEGNITRKRIERL